MDRSFDGEDGPSEEVAIQPRSWLWQTQLPASSMQKQLSSPGNRAFRTFGPAPVEVIAAREAFWDMGVTHRQKLAAVLNIDIKLEQKVSLCGVLFNMAKKILDISDSDTSDVLAKRLSRNDLDQHYSEGVLHLDEGVSLLETCDQEKMRMETQHLCHQADGHTADSKDFRDLKQEIRAAASKKAKISKTIWPSILLQSSVKDFCPPGAHIWVGRTSESWHGHMPPRRRMSASWSSFKDGEQGAVRDVLQRLWYQYAELQGLNINSLVSC